MQKKCEYKWCKYDTCVKKCCIWVHCPYDAWKIHDTQGECPKLEHNYTQCQEFTFCGIFSTFVSLSDLSEVQQYRRVKVRGALALDSPPKELRCKRETAFSLDKMSNTTKPLLCRSVGEWVSDVFKDLPKYSCWPLNLMGDFWCRRQSIISCNNLILVLDGAKFADCNYHKMLKMLSTDPSEKEKSCS